MGLVARWYVAVMASAAGFTLAWWVCGKLIGLDEGVSLGVAGGVLAVVLAVATWWAPRGVDSGRPDGNGGRRLVQKARGGRDVYLAGRDMVINQRNQDE